MACDFAGLNADCVHRHFKRIADMERSNRYKRRAFNPERFVGRAKLERQGR